MGKKIKKFLKKAAKAAIIGGAIYGATRLAKNRKKKALNAITAGDIASPKNYQIPDTGNMGVNPPVVKKLSPRDKRKKWRHGPGSDKPIEERRRNWNYADGSSIFNPLKKGGLVKSGKPKLAKKGWK